MHLLAHALHFIAYAIIFAAKYYKFPFYQGAEISGYLALAVMAGLAVSHTAFVKLAKLRKGEHKTTAKENNTSGVDNVLDSSTTLDARRELKQYPNAKRIIITRERETVEIYKD